MTAPRFSVVMPTYDRADTLLRAIDSVRAQTFTDWELLVVDDGSKDGTPALLASIDEPRMRVFRQQNQGVAGARNTALRQVQGELVSFLDSDDEWPAHHLALMSAFFDLFPDESLATSEWWEIFGPGRMLRHFIVEMSEWYPATAARIGSARFEEPPPQGDPVLRFYETRRPIGAWATAALEDTGLENVVHYRGAIFEHWRWGWLTALQPTVLRRALAEQVGLFDATYRVASDFPWLARACQLAPMNMFSSPGCYKHEFSADGQLPKEGHLVTGKHAVTFHEDVLRALRELYLSRLPDDPDLLALEGFRQYLAGHWALQQGRRTCAIDHLESARRHYDGADVEAALWLARALPDDALAGDVYRTALKALKLPSRVRSAVRRLAGAHP